MAVFIRLLLFLQKRPSQWLNCVGWPVALVKRIGLKYPYGEVVRAHYCISPSLKMASLGSQWQELPSWECMNTLHPEGPPEWLRWSPLTLISLFLFFFWPLNKNRVFFWVCGVNGIYLRSWWGGSQRVWGRKPLNRLQINHYIWTLKRHLNRSQFGKSDLLFDTGSTQCPLLWPTLLWAFILSSWCVCNASP